MIMAASSKPIRIWYQSFVDPVQQAAYCDELSRSLAAMAGPDVVFDVHGIDPPDLELHRLTEFRCSRQVIRNAVEAEREGCDAFAIGHFQDGGLYEARAAVDIPVLALGEAAMLYACMLGRKIALVTINPIFIPMHEEQIDRYGLGKRVVAVTAIQADPTMLVRAFTEEPAFQQVLDQFQRQVEPIVRAGADVVIPAGGLPLLLFARRKHFTIGHALVLNGIAALAKMAETAVDLHRFDGTTASRAGAFRKPSAKALQEFLES